MPINGSSAALRQLQAEVAERQRLQQLQRQQDTGLHAAVYVDTPTNWTTSPMDLSGSFPSYGSYSMAVDMSMADTELSKKNIEKLQRAALERDNSIESQRLKDFILRGYTSGKIYIHDNGTIYMVGSDRQPTHILFELKDKILHAHKDRVEHLLSGLKQLAKLYKVELVLDDAAPILPSGCKRVAYLAMNRKDYDDTLLVSQARPRPFRGEVRDGNHPDGGCERCGCCGENCDSCMHCEGCGGSHPSDCECPECYDSDEDEDDEEELWV